MKKMISMISVAVLAVVFAAGCGDDAKGSKGSGSHGSTDSVAAAAAAGKKVCDAGNGKADDTDCKAAAGNLADKADHTCVFTKHASDQAQNKCEYKSFVDADTAACAAENGKKQTTCEAVVLLSKDGTNLKKCTFELNGGDAGSDNVKNICKFVK